MEQAEIGLIGLGVMGSNLALNIAEKGYTVAVHNRTASKIDDFVVTAREQGLSERVVPEAEARVGKRVLLEIAAQKPEDGYLPGQYFGNVQIIFDALRP